MEFEAKRDDGLVHTFNISAEVIVLSYCGQQQCHYKDTDGDPTPDDPRCEECDNISQLLNSVEGK